MSRYAGDLPPKDAWSRLESDASCVLIDVRTRAEWTYVGVPDLSPLNKQAVLIEWQLFPDGNRNESFHRQVEALGLDKETPLLFLCRSGARSAAAAALMTEMGYTQCYNVAEGFEGDPDHARQRGRMNGWKVCGLPWIQG